MLIKEIMNTQLSSCTPDATLVECAQMMLQNDVGEIPVLADDASGRLVGVITDRDIVTRVVARDLNPRDVKVQAAMTDALVTITAEQTLEDAQALLADAQIRRVPVVDDQSCLIGIISLADLARYQSPEQVGRTVQDISAPASSPESNTKPSSAA